MSKKNNLRETYIYAIIFTKIWGDSAMSEKALFDQLVVLIDRLLAPDGCPWDCKQTVSSLSHMLLEEACEVVDAIQETDSESIADEMGDLFVVAIFLAKAAEREERFVWEKPFQKGIEKLIRRHPHIFAEIKELSVKDVEKQWQEIKKQEYSHRTNRYQGIPRSLPALSMMQKMIKKGSDDQALNDFLDTPCSDPQREIGRQLARIVHEAETQGFQAEVALRQFFNRCQEHLIE